MKLVYKSTNEEVKPGDRVQLSSDEWVEVHYFKEPHKTSSSGKVTVKLGGTTREFYVDVIDAHWIERAYN